MTIHTEALTDAGKTLLPKLGAFESFYLAGGTALALQIGHRVSVDFDFFHTDTLPDTLLKDVERVFPNAVIAPSVHTDDELTVFIDSVKFTFLHYPFPVLLPLVVYENLSLLSVEEIAVTKAYTIGRRGAYKDYVDLYFILSEKHTSLEEIISLAEKKYTAAFNSRLFLEQLVYGDDLEEVASQFLKESISKDTIMAFFEQVVSRISL